MGFLWPVALAIAVGGGIVWQLNAIRLQLNAIRTILLHPELLDETRDQPD